MMTSFQEYILEYYKGNPILNVNMSNGKNINRVFQRKNPNTAPEEYKRKVSIVDKISSGKANNITIGGSKLNHLLKLYNMKFAPGKTKVIGNSNVSITMRVSPSGIQQGICRNRKL
jgi:hypothetical protein